MSSKTKHMVHYNVKCGDIIIWEFATKKRDIGFGESTMYVLRIRVYLSLSASPYCERSCHYCTHHHHHCCCDNDSSTRNRACALVATHSYSFGFMYSIFFCFLEAVLLVYILRIRGLTMHLHHVMYIHVCDDTLHVRTLRV